MMAGGGYHIDPDAIGEALLKLQGIQSDSAATHQQCRAHQQRAGGLLQQLGQQLQALPEELHAGLWDTLGFGGLASDVSSTNGQIQGLRSRTGEALSHLRDTHPEFAWRFEEAFGPICQRFDDAVRHTESAAGALGAWNIWNLFRDPDLLFTPLGGTIDALGNALAEADKLHSVLDWLRQQEENLINLTDHSLEWLWNAARNDPAGFATLAKDLQNWKDAADFVHRLLENKGLKAFRDDLPTFHGFALSALWTAIANGDFTPHGFGSALYGTFIDSIGAALANPEAAEGILATELGISTATVVTGAVAGVFSLVASLQGGPWGSALNVVANDWQAVSQDTDQIGNIVTDLGAIAFDLHAGTIVAGVATFFVPELAPLVPTIFQAELFGGSDPRHLGTDFHNLFSDASAIPHLANDLGRAGSDTVTVVSDDAASSLIHVLPVSDSLKASTNTVLLSDVAHHLAYGGTAQ